MKAGERGLLIAGAVILIGIVAVVFLSPPGTGQKTVVVYTSVDQVYSEPVFRDFENRTGIRVLPVYDVEATKTTGLVNRLIAESPHPQADVFWCAEFSQMLLLKNQTVLAPYVSPSGSDIPSRYRDPDGYWTAFGGRARAFIVNTDLLPQSRYPRRIADMLDPAYPGPTIGMAYPMFGTTATQAAAIYSTWGYAAAHAFYQNISDRKVRIADGNSVVRDLVSSGQLAFGITDTDDACTAMGEGKHVALVIPDQEAGGMGTLVIPDTVALIRGGPDPENGRRFIDYLLSPATESGLIRSGWIQVPSRTLPDSSPCLNGTVIRPMTVSYPDVYNSIQMTKTDLAEIFIR